MSSFYSYKINNKPAEFCYNDDSKNNNNKRKNMSLWPQFFDSLFAPAGAFDTASDAYSAPSDHVHSQAVSLPEINQATNHLVLPAQDVVGEI